MLGRTPVHRHRAPALRRSKPAVTSFIPGMGTIGGNGMGGLAFASGLGDSSSYVIAPGANVDQRFSAGEPGIYIIRMVVEGVKLTSETKTLHSTAPYNDALRAQGIDATVTQVRYVGQDNARRANAASDLLKEVFGTGNPDEDVIADMSFDVTVRIDTPPAADRSPGSPSDSIPDWTPEEGLQGLGVVQIGAGAVFAIIAVVAVVLAVTFPGFGKMVLAGVSFVGAVAGTAVGGAAKAVASNAVPLLIAAGVVAGAIFLLKKGGAKYASKSGRFSF